VSVAEPDVAARLGRLVAWFEALTPASLADIGTLYADDVRFKDPFNEVQGLAATRRIFEHMFETLAEARFVVHSRLAQGDEAFLTWDFHLRTRSGRGLCIRGASHLRFAADGRVGEHRDYWDAAEELYSQLPVLGGLMRWLRRQSAAG
jgi:ketosteroid isomerase-like protein